MDEIVEKLKQFMADYDLTIDDIARKINRNPRTIWLFLHQKVKPQDRTLYKIKRLLGEIND